MLQELIESMIDKIISHEPQKIQKRISELKLKHAKLDQKQIAQKIINDQSIWGGMLGATTGLGGVILLPATVSVDLVKYLRVQAYMICCLSYLHGYSLDDYDTLKTDLFLILSHSSMDEIKRFVCLEAKKQVKNDASKKEAIDKLMRFNSLKDVTANAGKSLVLNHVTRVTMKFGQKQVMNHTLRGVPKVFRGLIWRLGGRKIAEKTVQKTAAKAVPVLGAVVGGAVDWWLIKSVGKVAIDYYQNDGPLFVQAAGELTN
jgi:hypothetical protein